MSLLQPVLPRYTVATLPLSPQVNLVVVVTDGASGSDCSTGGGSTRALCIWTGAAWQSLGGGGGGGSTAFSSLTSGTNTAAAMAVGTGASLATSGSGTIAASTAVALAAAPTKCATAAPYSFASGIGANGNAVCPDSNLTTDGSGNVSLTSLSTTGPGPLTISTTPGTCGTSAAGKGQLCFSSTGNRPVYGYNGGANVNLALATDGDTVVSANHAGSPYTAALGQAYACDASGGAVVINLPAATGSGKGIQIWKVDSSSNACSPAPNGSDAIDGANAAYNLTAQWAASRVEDYASGAWKRTHVNQLAGDATGASTNNQVVSTHISGATNNYLPVFSSGNLVNSDVTDNGATVTSALPLAVNGTGAGALDLKCGTAQTASSGYVSLQAPASCTSYGFYTLPALPSAQGLLLAGAASSNASTISVAGPLNFLAVGNDDAAVAFPGSNTENFALFKVDVPVTFSKIYWDVNTSDSTTTDYYDVFIAGCTNNDCSQAGASWTLTCDTGPLAGGTGNPYGSAGAKSASCVQTTPLTLAPGVYIAGYTGNATTAKLYVGNYRQIPFSATSLGSSSGGQVGSSGTLPAAGSAAAYIPAISLH